MALVLVWSLFKICKSGKCKNLFQQNWWSVLLSHQPVKQTRCNWHRRVPGTITSSPASRQAMKPNNMGFASAGCWWYHCGWCWMLFLAWYWTSCASAFIVKPDCIPALWYLQCFTASSIADWSFNIRLADIQVVYFGAFLFASAKNQFTDGEAGTFQYRVCWSVTWGKDRAKVLQQYVAMQLHQPQITILHRTLPSVLLRRLLIASTLMHWPRCRNE